VGIVPRSLTLDVGDLVTPFVVLDLDGPFCAPVAAVLDPRVVGAPVFVDIFLTLPITRINGRSKRGPCCTDVS